jgi:hypothetical protein
MTVMRGTFSSATTITNDDLAALEKLCNYFRWDTSYEQVSTDDGLTYFSLSLGVVPFMIVPSGHEWHLVHDDELQLAGKTMAEVCHKTICMFPTINERVVNGRGIQTG